MGPQGTIMFSSLKSRWNLALKGSVEGKAFRSNSMPPFRKQRATAQKSPKSKCIGGKQQGWKMSSPWWHTLCL